MNRVVFMLLAWAFCTSRLQADDVAKLAGLGSYFENPKGELVIQLEGGHTVWQNGNVLIRRPYPDCAMAYGAFLKPGDSLIVGGEDGFTRYRLEALSAQEASFTIWHYASELAEVHRHRLGRLLATDTAKVDLPLEIFGNSEVNGVQLGRLPASRTK